MKNFEGLNTDYYQIAMAFVNVMENRANIKTGYEGFVRNIKKNVNLNENFYIFDGHHQVVHFIEQFRKDIVDPEFKETFISLISPKITSKYKTQIINEFYIKWENIDFEFEYNVVPNGTIVKSFVPVFQYKGPSIWGQILETYITNIYNGRTALATIKYLRTNNMEVFISNEEFDFIDGIINDNVKALNVYEKNLKETAKMFRDSTSKMILEAAFRRAPSKIVADMASMIAIKNGWNGTSNVGVRLKGWIDDSKIGGTMAHAFIMSYENERDAFIAWDKYFPGTTMLIDTYNVVNAANMISNMIDEGIITAPKDVRIDSDPLDKYSKQVDEIFNGKTKRINIAKIDNFISGDMSIDKFKNFENNNIPYSKAMAGTKYVYNNSIIEKLNSGFVYKIVEYTNKDGIKIKPEKKATGKKNYSGLKYVEYDMLSNTIIVECGSEKSGFRNMENVKIDTEVIFKD